MKLPKEWPNQTAIGQVPIQGDWDDINNKNLPPSSIPRWLAEIAYTNYVKHGGSGQTLDRLCERGGFGRMELLVFLRNALNTAELPDWFAKEPTTPKGSK